LKVETSVASVLGADYQTLTIESTGEIILKASSIQHYQEQLMF
jgi:hypothetical protein